MNFRESVMLGKEEIVFTNMGKSNSLKMEFPSIKNSEKLLDIYISNLKVEDYLPLISVLLKFMKEKEMNFNKIPIYKCFYNEDISVFIDTVERTLSISSSRLSFVAYTNADDDHYMILRPGGIREFVGLVISGYIKESEDFDLEKILGKRRVKDVERIAHALSLLEEGRREVSGLFKVSRDQVSIDVKKPTELEIELQNIMSSYLEEILEGVIDEILTK